jgi:hypothetical protein
MVTKPLSFSGTSLQLNYRTSAAGAVRVEVQDVAGAPVSGFALDECRETIGDEIERALTWEGGSSLSDLTGKGVRLRFHLKDADLFSFKFQ